MRRAGGIMARIKAQLPEVAKAGVSFAQIDSWVRSEIEKEGAETNFDREKGYRHAICVNKNAGICHGIPHDYLKVEAGDLMKVDMGCGVDGWQVDSAMSWVVAGGDAGERQEREVFLNRGRLALKKAIAAAQPEASIYDISLAMEKALTKHGYSMVYQLCGHGIGRKLHEEPLIPCIADGRDKSKIIKAGDALAIEVMYAAGNATLLVAEDGWTYETKDGSLTGYFEETVIVGASPEVVTSFGGSCLRSSPKKIIRSRC